MPQSQNPNLRHDAWQLDPMELPDQPREGMKIWVKRGPEFGDGDRYGVSRVNARSLYLSVEGAKMRMPLSSWHPWIEARMSDGQVSINGHPIIDRRKRRPSGESTETAGSPTREAAAMAHGYSLSHHATAPTTSAPVMAMATQKGSGSYGMGHGMRGAYASMNTAGPQSRKMRDARVLRAIRSVLKEYTIREESRGTDGVIIFHVKKGKKAPYIVQVDPSWEQPIDCSCPDSFRSRDTTGNVFCKHSIAVCLSDEDLRHLLIDLFI